ncbi:MAG TPA: glycoside hydrolase family 76 protein [Actinotalea caeni]|uniref:glycoside hydrolase family 76 protein n=1 Tax=Actinotalea caeni TaxID=1348467 RepID=UPI0012E1A19A|nr:glycoside hydrolase family 76 protein [Actinotalea caeni]HLV56043.1 glycoside hydrolase family 76 protein [Actinotalea caeni]
MADHLDWPARADLAHRSLAELYGAPPPQLLNNTRPVDDNETFNYWWLAHAVDVALDGWERTGDETHLRTAVEIVENLLARNGGSLFNDYFDDMLWLGLALERLSRAPGRGERLEDARTIWRHCLDEGWNDTMGGGIAWRKPQLGYKNTPANGPFVILGARLAGRLGADDPYLVQARRCMAWLREHLVRPDGTVEDGVNREGDGRVDTDWRYTYNYGLFVGACVELFAHDGDEEWLALAERSARRAVELLAVDGVFPESGGGDVGLFKGIFYRYLDLLLALRPAPDLVAFVRAGTDVLWRVGHVDGVLWAGDDWRVPPAPPTSMSTQLSAVMATEVRTRVEARALSHAG